MTCYLCGEKGSPLYCGLNDRLFDVPGNWDLYKCTNMKCGLMWIEPMPAKSEVWRLYREYYTHGEDEPPTEKANVIIRSTKRLIRLPYSALKRILLVTRGRKRLDLMYVGRLKPGRLLEVGCGNGDRLNKIRKLGWEVEGQDIDTKAVNYARKKHNLKIHHGELQGLLLLDSEYDAVVLNHVIEHVHDPVDLLRECHRLLKLGGRLVVVTPNINSFGANIYRVHWFGLDPPRHLYLFSMETLKKVAVKAGFGNPRIWTTAVKAETFARGSMIINEGMSLKGSNSSSIYRFIAPMIFQIKAKILHMFSPGSGEECVLEAIKK
ncbi:MAG: class I SAM-dependent methyltransferase [Nitrospirota bacterium]|nr:MAG: class I SAM-dependent methyltransferase [Nitrospirota bacterium]